MPRRHRRFCPPLHLALPLCLGILCGLYGDDADPHKSASKEATYRGPSCVTDNDYFLNEVWTKVAAQACLKCHKSGGDAEDSKLVLEDPLREKTPGAASQHNREAFAQIA